MVDYVAIGRRIRTMRRDRDLSQGKLASLAGISGAFLGHIERGTRIMSLETLMSICDSLDCTPDVLMGLETPAAQSPAVEEPERPEVSVPLLLRAMADLMESRRDDLE